MILSNRNITIILSNRKVLVAGIGTTGCEILKILLFYNCDITIMDYDTVMVTDLNRQFFSRDNNIGKSKVSVIKEYFKNYYGKNINIINRNLFQTDIAQSNMQFDIIFCCFDNLESRMELNIRAASLRCVLIDLGIENQFVHIKRVIYGRDACLYCMKDLYTNNRFYNICSLRGSLRREDQIYILLQKYNQEENLSEKQQSSVYIATRSEDRIVTEVVNTFNTMNSHKTDEQEVIGIRDNIIANTCYIGSIAASMAVMVLEDKENDFWFYNGMKRPYILKNKIERDKKCFICAHI